MNNSEKKKKGKGYKGNELYLATWNKVKRWKQKVNICGWVSVVKKAMVIGRTRSQDVSRTAQ
jgi:hypothetical protein